MPCIVWKIQSLLSCPTAFLMASPWAITINRPAAAPLARRRFTISTSARAHFLPYNYYGGHYGANNDNHYDLFSASGMDFIVIYFEYDDDDDDQLSGLGVGQQFVAGQSKSQGHCRQPLDHQRRVQRNV